MQALNLPTYSFKIKSDKGVEYILDRFRQKYVKLTPEEWVRQHFAEYLVEEKGFPRGRIALEYALYYNRMKKRCDILVFDQYMQAQFLVECKAPGVKTGRDAFDQAAVYNQVFKLKYLAVTNGMEHYCCRIDSESSLILFLEEIPDYDQL